MAQIFSRSSNTLSKVTLGLILLLVVGGLWLMARFQGSPYVTEAFNARTQPVQFSHEHHVGQLGVHCLYCHTSVEDSAFAGIPPTGTCMNCHRQIWTNAPALEPVRQSWKTGEPIRWTRVHDLPDFVYFNHSIHVHKGIGCSSCHGRVDRMPLTWQTASLTMSWCLDCHRNPEQHVRPLEDIYSMTWEPPSNQLEIGKKLVAEYDVQKRTSCSFCHR